MIKNSRQNLISFTVLFDNFFGYKEKKSMGDLHQLIKHKIFEGDWDEFRANWSKGLDMYDKIIDGINSYEEAFDRMVKILSELPLSDDAKKSFLELTVEMYHETSSTSGIIESEINDENQINKQHPNYSKFKVFEYLSSAMRDDIVLNFLVNLKQKNTLKGYCELQTSKFFVADTMDGIISDNCEFLFESDTEGTSYFRVDYENGKETDSFYADINSDEALELKDYEGKFLKIIYTNQGNGTVEFSDGDEVDTNKPLFVEFGLFNTIPLKDGEELDIVSNTIYDSPTVETCYYLVKDGVAIELYEFGEELFYSSDDEPV